MRVYVYVYMLFLIETHVRMVWYGMYVCVYGKVCNVCTFGVLCVVCMVCIRVMYGMGLRCSITYVLKHVGLLCIYARCECLFFMCVMFILCYVYVLLLMCVWYICMCVCMCCAYACLYVCVVCMYVCAYVCICCVRVVLCIYARMYARLC